MCEPGLSEFPAQRLHLELTRNTFEAFFRIAIDIRMEFQTVTPYFGIMDPINGVHGVHYIYLYPESGRMQDNDTEVCVKN
jgi:hypothetical protein